MIPFSLLRDVWNRLVAQHIATQLAEARVAIRQFLPLSDPNHPDLETLIDRSSMERGAGDQSQHLRKNATYSIHGGNLLGLIFGSSGTRISIYSSFRRNVEANWELVVGNLRPIVIRPAGSEHDVGRTCESR